MNIVKICLFASAITLLAIGGPSVAGDRMVIGEMFTNTSCGPCYPAELRLDQIAEDYVDVLALIRYHVWWPSQGDPYYQFNTPECVTRNNYYQNNYAPHFFIDGNIDGQEVYGMWEGQIDNESFNLSPLTMEMWGTFDRDSLAGTVSVRIIPDDDPGLSNLRLRLALTESNIHWNAPNGITVHNQTFRDMIPSTYGQVISLAMGDTLEYTFSFNTRSPIVPVNCEIVAFVQSEQNRNILQGAKISIPEMDPTGIADDGSIPKSFSLSQNYPNPFNAETKIDFATRGGRLSLQIFDITGARIAGIAGGDYPPGAYSVTWDGRDSHGNPVSSGTYFYRLTHSSTSQTRRMTLLK
jgi:hypothetical protein